MALEVAELVAKLKADTSNFTTGMKAAQNELRTTGGHFENLRQTAVNFGNTMGPVGGNIASALFSPQAAVAGLGVAFSKFATDGITSFLNLAGEVRSFSRVTGATAEDSSKLVAAMHALNINADAGTAAMFRFSKNIDMHANNLIADGVAIATNAKGQHDLVGTLLNVGDAYRNLQDPVAKNKLLFDAFGRSGQTLAPLLGKTREELQSLFDAASRHHEILSQADLDKARDFKLATHDLQEAFTGLEREAGSALIPMLTSLANTASHVIDVFDSLSKTTGETSGSWKGMLGPLGDVIESVKSWTGLSDLNGWLSMNTQASHDYKDSAKDVAEAQKVVEDTTAADAKAYSDLQSKTIGVANANRDLATAHRGVSTASENVASKQRELNKLLSEGAVDAKAVKTAEHDLENAARSLEKAQDGLAKATQGVADAQQIVNDLASGKTRAEELAKHLHDEERGKLAVRAATLAQSDALEKLTLLQTAADPETLARAQNKVQLAQEKLTKAQVGGKATVADLTKLQLDLGDAQDNLTQLQSVGTPTARELAQAQLDLDNATLNLTTSQEDLKNTQDSLNQINKIGSENSPEMIQGRKDLNTATDNLKDATQGVADATAVWQDKQLALKTALAGDPDYQTKIADARRGVRDATQGLSDASFNASQKSYELRVKTDELTTALGGSHEMADQLIGNLRDIIRLSPDAAPFLNTVIAAMNATTTAAAVTSVFAAIQANKVPTLTGPAVPRFATGGTVAGQFGSPQTIVAHGGERIIPAGQSGGDGGTYINLTVNGIVDGDDGARKIQKILLDLNRRTGTLGFS